MNLEVPVSIKLALTTVGESDSIGPACSTRCEIGQIGRIKISSDYSAVWWNHKLVEL